MKYLIMIQMNPSARAMWESLTDEQRADGYQLHKDMVSRLEASGELVVSEALADVSLTRRVNVKDGVVTTTDGPFAEVKEYLAGFYLVDCENIDRAIEHAARLPEAGLGLVEVRPVMELP
ncbi:YciI family protein [Kibdelosporangium persicum]|uniref:YCII domain-containing protein n=1 Tax=Kibdelosporangium persicum TaxID=2698649 RepID=A0ABX2F559_9PSEU|nr:YciI family protein [Kibdelosporangium persicum]NRN65940.1 YCII domain-containing protein [Kibdelosporangium persicum]